MPEHETTSDPRRADHPESPIDEMDKPGHTLNMRAVRRTVVGGVIGSIVEFYEFSVYAVLASTLAAVFFPATDPTVALLSTLAVFGLAFFARPLGGFFWGVVGDRIGRKRTLAFTIILMSVSTLLIGVLPGYASIGVAAPTLLILLRFTQGFSAGGEISGAVSFIAEHSPRSRRGFYVGMITVGAGIGTLLGTIVPASLLLTIGHSEMLSWGWRIPFLLAMPMGVIAVYIRRRLDETPYFLTLKQEHLLAKNPLVTAVTGRKQRILLLKAFLITSLNAASFYVVAAYLPSFAIHSLKLSGVQAYMPVIVAVLSAIVAEVTGARLSDRIGRRPVLLGAGTGLLILALPSFLLITSASLGAKLIGLILIGICTGAYAAVTNTALIEMFSTSVRVTGHGITYNLSVALFGGLAPFLLAWLGGLTGSSLVGAFYLIVLALVALPAVFVLPETAQRPLKSS